ncbi:radical SAM protein [Sphaerisporangium flaviroseum]|uniref:Radical SAM protein n=1 Tax=Sphaerisporangium flaviroseum TaxID=509199 RepID=A0ABP7I6E7_9ACTN
MRTSRTRQTQGDAITSRPIAGASHASSCYFRTTVPDGQRKALVQITEKCNLRCAHCFVSATQYGDTMTMNDLEDKVVPRLAVAGVTRVTLTGGEPFAHPDPLGVIQLFQTAGMSVGVCTNATLTSDKHIEALAAMPGVHVNVSLDGFAADSHGKFRGDRASFAITVDTVRRFAAAGLLQGLLCTPNRLAEVTEYEQLCAFAVECGAQYVLMNPLSSMGRGAKAKKALATADAVMSDIAARTAPFAGQLELVNIRFPNEAGLPLAGCEAGRIIYVFTSGEVTACPYLVFAARTAVSRHDPGEFIVGNIYTDPDIGQRLDAYNLHDRYRVGANSTCSACSMEQRCGKGCPAAVVAVGGRIGDLDAEQCPVTAGRVPAGRLLPVVP